MERNYNLGGEILIIYLGSFRKDDVIRKTGKPWKTAMKISSFIMIK